jgi:protein-S-isoprenylcysteine O-methyltransferase Ste14
VLDALRSVGWLASIVYATIPLYWLMIHPFAAQWRERTGSPFRVLVPAWIAIWVIFATLTWHWHDIPLYSTPWSWAPAVLLFASGIFIYRQVGASFSWSLLAGLPEISPTNQAQRLVTTGIRARVRHPIYLAHLCELLAWSVGTGLAVSWGLTAFGVVTGAVMIRLEDAELEKRFGDEYRGYRAKVPAVLPGPAERSKA